MWPGLPLDMDDQEFKEIFEDYGMVRSAKIILDKETSKSRGFGFVDMADRSVAENIIKRLDGGELDGQKLTVRPAEPRKKNPNTPRKDRR